MEFILIDMVRLQKSNTFGGRLAEGREEAERWDGSGIGYNQEELADLLAERYGVKIGRSYISELERNWQQNKMPSMEVARALAQALGVNLNWLALLSEDKEPPDAAKDEAWSPTTNAIMNVVDKWPEPARQAMLAAAQAVSPYMLKDDKQEVSGDTATKMVEDWIDSVNGTVGTPGATGTPKVSKRRSRG